jgi:hypothetical protein
VGPTEEGLKPASKRGATEVKGSSLTRGSLVLTVCLFSSTGMSAEEVMTPVGRVLLNPVSFHRTPVILQGVVKALTMYEERVVLGRLQCAQGFKLQDDTGVIDVIWNGWCQIGEEKAVTVAVGDGLLVHATIEAPPDNLRDTQGSDFGLKAVATKVVRTPKP